MFLLVQTVAALAAIALTYFAFADDPPPIIVGVLVAFAASWIATKLLAIWKYGIDNKVTPSRPE